MYGFTSKDTLVLHETLVGSNVERTREEGGTEDFVTLTNLFLLLNLAFLLAGFYRTK